MKKNLILLVFLANIAGCVSRYEDNPAEIGRGRDDMKQSRCACIEIYRDGIWL